MFGFGRRRTALTIKMFLLAFGPLGWVITGDAYFGRSAS